MSMESGGMSVRWTVRQKTKPPSGGPPYEWINPEGGANGNNSERYTYNDTAESWELNKSVGPDQPQYPTEGAEWYDTGTGDNNIYRSGAWKSIVGDNLTLTSLDTSDTFTDPSGSSHTGEMADISDVFSPSVIDSGTVDVSASSSQDVIVTSGHKLLIAGASDGDYAYATAQMTWDSAAGKWRVSNTQNSDIKWTAPTDDIEIEELSGTSRTVDYQIFAP